MKHQYEAPRIVDERILEAHAMACQKTPGIGASNILNFCGQVWVGRHGVHTSGCSMNENSRSS
jgi:hypothetical protein